MFKKFFWLMHLHGIKKLNKSGLKIGRDTLIFNEPKDYGCEPALVSIGDRCVVASGVRFITNRSVIGALQEGAAAGKLNIMVHDNCFLGMNAIIYQGVTIGADAVVGAGAVVMSDVPPGTCVNGNPARVSCTLELYRAMSKRGSVPDYTTVNKRRLLEAFFWGSDKVGAKAGSLADV